MLPPPISLASRWLLPLRKARREMRDIGMVPRDASSQVSHTARLEVHRRGGGESGLLYPFLACS